MSAYIRPLHQKIESRLAEKPRYLQLIEGPRQSGKTTLILQVLKRISQPYAYLSVDSPSQSLFLSDSDSQIESVPFTNGIGTAEATAQWLIHHWERARSAPNRLDTGFVLVIDEIQKIPDWSSTIKGLWDRDKHRNRLFHVVLLGSSPLHLQTGLNENLTGRFELIQNPHWSFEEMHHGFNIGLEQFIYFGGYPGGQPLIYDNERWLDYIEDSILKPTIGRDILAMQRITKPSLLESLLLLSCEYSGQILSYNKMLGQLHDAGNTTTLARYLNLASSVGCVAGIEKFSRKSHKTRASSPKLNVFNTALMSSSSKYTFEEAKADRSFWGRLVESAVGAHLLNTSNKRVKVFYWRDGNYEIDFILERHKELIGIEVKSGRRQAKTIGFDAFSRQFSLKKAIVVGEQGMPLTEFLSIPAWKLFS